MGFSLFLDASLIKSGIPHSPALYLAGVVAKQATTTNQCYTSFLFIISVVLRMQPFHLLCLQ